MIDHIDDARADGTMLVRYRAEAVEVTFDRPARMNALTSQIYTALLDLCAELRDRPEVRAVVFQGAGGRAFSAGNEISEFVGVTDGESGVAYEARVRAVLRAVAELPQVTVAAIDGVCAGAGLALATHCDLRLCAAGSRFGYPIAHTLGNALSISVLRRCASVFGESLTREMLLAARLIDADRAYGVGAVLDVVNPGDLAAAIQRLVAEISRTAPLTVATTKEQLRSCLPALDEVADDARLAEVYGSADFQEGVRSFLAKEKPRWSVRP